MKQLMLIGSLFLLSAIFFQNCGPAFVVAGSGINGVASLASQQAAVEVFDPTDKPLANTGSLAVGTAYKLRVGGGTAAVSWTVGSTSSARCTLASDRQPVELMCSGPGHLFLRADATMIDHSSAVLVSKRRSAIQFQRRRRRRLQNRSQHRCRLRFLRLFQPRYQPRFRRRYRLRSQHLSQLRLRLQNRCRRDRLDFLRFTQKPSLQRA